MKRLLYTATALGALALAPAAMAAPGLTGDINFDGSDSYNATTVTFVNPQGVSSATGNLTAFGTCTNCITALDVNYNPLVSPITNWLSGTNPATSKTFALDLLSTFNIVFQPGLDLDFDGNAVMHLTGFADTPGEVFFSTQGPNDIEVSFSATAVPTPEPATIALLGVGMLGLGYVQQKRRR